MSTRPFGLAISTLIFGFMSQETLESAADLSLQTSQWVIASEASISDAEGRLDLVIHSLAANPSTPFTALDGEQLLDLSGQRSTLPQQAIPKAEQLFEARLGLQMRVREVGVGGPNISVDAKANELTIGTWLLRLGLPYEPRLGKVVLRTPVPVLGSPPQDWQQLSALIGNAAPSPFLLAAGVAAWGDRPVLALISGGTGVVMWFGKPFAQTVRDHYVGILQKHLERDD